jgi:hypothetical protein
MLSIEPRVACKAFVETIRFRPCAKEHKKFYFCKSVSFVRLILPIHKWVGVCEFWGGVIMIRMAKKIPLLWLCLFISVLHANDFRLVGIENTTAQAEVESYLPTLIQGLVETFEIHPEKGRLLDSRVFRHTHEARAAMPVQNMEQFLTLAPDRIKEVAYGADYLLFGQVGSASTLFATTGYMNYHLYLMDVKARQISVVLHSVHNQSILGKKDEMGKPVVNPAVVGSRAHGAQWAMQSWRYSNQTREQIRLRGQIDYLDDFIAQKAQGESKLYGGIATAALGLVFGFWVDNGLVKLISALGGGALMVSGYTDKVMHNQAIMQREHLMRVWKIQFNYDFN